VVHYYGQFDPPVDRYLLETFFSESSDPGFFVECGAFDGVYDSSCLIFEERFGWDGVNIEASDFIFPFLQSRRKASMNLNLALSNKSGTALFRHVSDETHGSFLGWGSIEHQRGQLDEIEAEGMVVTEHPVQTSTWRELECVQCRDNVDLFVLDVEGHELAVIEGMSGSRRLPRIMCVEHTQVGLAPLEEKLRPLGYELHSSVHANSFFVLGGSSNGT
jgi:FkbM family methyltransferase